MEVAAVINVHSNPKIVLDTLDSVFTYMTDKALVVVDGASRAFDSVELPVGKINGFHHNCPRSPYRNVSLGLSVLADAYPDVDWYLYLEYDCLVTSERFKKNLKMAEERGIWMLGCDGHVDDVQMPYINSLIGEEFKSIYYLLGCCQFMHRNFINKLKSINFFDRFLTMTNQFSEGYMPGYNGYDISEHMYPTLARHFGGNIGVFATYDSINSKWHGSYEVFPMRWKPELDPLTENYPEASIMHPLKTFEHPIRTYHREKRKYARATTAPVAVV